MPASSCWLSVLTMKLTLIYFIGFLALFSTINGQGIGALRLIISGQYSPTQSYSTGIVEIYYDGTWGNICLDTSFGSYEADVICHQLAFTGASSYTFAGSTSIYGTDRAPTLLEDVDCRSSSYLVLLQCSYRSHYSTYCNDNINDVIVLCYSKKIWNKNPFTGQLRIVNGTYSNQGRLEIYCNGQWGTVCDDSFGATDANVACRQLGYSNYSRYNYNTSIYAGSSSQPIWLDNVLCTSSSTKCLTSCESCPSSQYHNCDHSKDVSLECEFSLSSTSGPNTTLSTCNPNQYSGDNSDGPDITIGLSIGFAVFFSIIGCIILFVCICCCAGNNSTSQQSTSQHGQPQVSRKRLKAIIFFIED